MSFISVGARGASFNIPVARSGCARTTLGVPGTGLSWSVEHTPDRNAAIPVGSAAGLPNSRRLRPGQLDALKQQLLEVLLEEWLLEQLVFVGGAVAGVLITDPAMPEIRPTQDVDVICSGVFRRTAARRSAMSLGHRRPRSRPDASPGRDPGLLQ